MVTNTPTGMANGSVGIVFDAYGQQVAPQRPYTLIDAWGAAYRAIWASVEEMSQSLMTAPPAGGLPEGAPSPNSVYSENGRLIRYVIDPEIKREPFVHEYPDGTQEVRERIQFRKQYVALSLAEAQRATDMRREGDPETDFWCGYTWLRGGYTPERTAPVAVQQESLATMGGTSLIFDQPASPTDAARIRHEVANMDRRAPTLPIEGRAPAAPAPAPAAPAAAPRTSKKAAAADSASLPAAPDVLSFETALPDDTAGGS